MQRQIEKAEEVRAYWKRYRLQHLEKKAAYLKEYAEANKEALKVYSRGYRAENAGKITASKREYYDANRDRILDEGRRRRRENAGAINERARARWAEAPERYRVKAHNRRARQRANGGALSTNIGDILYGKQQGRCAVCLLRLKRTGTHLDHILPLVLGGPNDDSNVQLLCPPCNLQKNRKHPIEFMQSRGKLF